ncbi:MAG: chromosomal replication initiator protein DnaA [Candidatus Caenarcaniphilales bacterium]|nr:chromosomal replication initiator protein DnaA [Candidatus Caenarcaniphilales bacterium]
MDTTELERIWKSALKSIKDEVPSSSFKAWIKPAHLLGIEDNKAILEVRNEFSKNLLIQNYFRSITKGLEKAYGKELELLIKVNGQLQNQDYTPSLSSIADSLPRSGNNSLRNNSVLKKNDNTQNSHPSNHYSQYSGQKDHSNLNPKFLFDNFIVGSHNQFCHAAALAIAQNKSKDTYNPFFIYGDVGLGKTHIMHAIGNHILKQNPDAKILYLSTEKFLNDLISFMRKSKMNEFRGKYRSLDLLLIDDIQFIEGKEATQEEFFHTFNSLKDNGSQIVLTSDRPPKAIERLEPRLCSRFEGGLIADVHAPTYETRLAIIARKSDELRMKVGQEIADLIANAFPENIRRLEGALTKLQAYTSFTSQELSSELVQRVLQINIAAGIQKLDEIKPETVNEKKIDLIMDLVSKNLNIPKNEILSRSNSKEIKNARQLCMAIARSSGLSLGEISRSFDGRGNSAIINACKRVQQETKKDDTVSSIFNQIKEKVLSTKL